MGTVDAPTDMEEKEIAVVDVRFRIKKRFGSRHTMYIVGKIERDVKVFGDFSEVEIFPGCIVGQDLFGSVFCVVTGNRDADAPYLIGISCLLKKSGERFHKEIGINLSLIHIFIRARLKQP